MAGKTATKQRIKSTAVRAAQSETHVASMIREIGDASREIGRLTHAMNDEIAEIAERYQQRIAPHQAELVALQDGVQAWCESRRETLTNSGKTKTYNFITGTVQWRQRPPSVSVRGLENVLELLRLKGLDAYIRVKEEINRDAILAEPDAVKGVRGISIVTGVEDFVIEPFEQEVKPS